jgi:protein-tyrosine phosphatase
VTAAQATPSYIDLHVHYVPGVDDGVRTLADGVALCRGLAALGYARVVATPHIRAAMFDNQRSGLEAAFQQFVAHCAGLEGLPELGLGAEHFCDDHFWELMQRDEALPYPGGRAALIELPPERLPLGLEQRFFDLQIRGVRPVIAHPERYSPLFEDSAALERLLDLGSCAQLDLMSLTGKYGRRPKRAAERLLEEGMYDLACSDCHDPHDLGQLSQAIDRLQALVGPAEAQLLMAENPARILAGSALD